MIYEYTLQPIESTLEIAFIILIGVSQSPFISLVLLALLVRLVTIPLEKYASRAVNHQVEIEAVLSPQVDVIKKQWKGAQRHDAIKRLYGRYAYHPFLAIRNLAGIGVQLPFFIAAFFMLSNSDQLAGVSIPVLGALDQPDSLLFSNIHLMPFVMTVVNILALITVPRFTRKNMFQGIFISLIFLVLLYSSPLGLLIYWTASNLFSLASNFVPAVRKKLNLRKADVLLKNTFLGRAFEGYAYIFFVTNLAILVPLLGVLGDQFNFFTAHGLSARSIIILFLIIAFLPSLVLVSLRFLAKKLSIIKTFDSIVLFIFLGLFIIYTFNNIGYDVFPAKFEPYILFVLAVILTVLAVTYIIRTNAIKVLSYLSLIIPLVFLNFIYVSPSASLFKTTNRNLFSNVEKINDTPIFLLVFDEFSGLTLQNSDGKLDELRYPGFAELANNADYFPNALTIHYQTSVAVPSIVSGTVREGNNAGIHPRDNLIAYYMAKSSVYSHSVILPADLMSQRDNDHINLPSVLSDILTLYLHIINHQDWITSKIGTIPQNWNGFGIFFNDSKPLSNVSRVNTHLHEFENWLNKINDENARKELNFYHMLFPHYPYDTTSLGRSVINNTAITPAVIKGVDLVGNESSINAAYHNYLQQSAYTDHLVSNLIKALKSKNLFDKSLIIVTSDHGVSHNKEGISRREIINEDSWKSIISIPLIIKYPNQKAGRVNSSFVTNLDILPTIFNVNGEEPPWNMAGQNLKSLDQNSQSRSVELVSKYKDYFSNIKGLFQSERDKKKALFSEGVPVNEVFVNYTLNPKYNNLINTSLSEYKLGESSSLYANFQGVVSPSEISFYGTMLDANGQPNNRVVAAVRNGKIQAVFETGKAKDKEGFFAFSLPEEFITATEFDVTLYEIMSSAPYILRKIQVESIFSQLEKEFTEKKPLPYNWKETITSNGLKSISVDKSGIKIAPLNGHNDPYVVFKSISNEPLSEPIFRVNIKQNEYLPIQLYYKTLHNPQFSESQQISHMGNKTGKSIYFKIEDKDVMGHFRLDFGNTVGDTEILIESVEIRY